MGGEILPDTAIVNSGAFCEANFLRYVIEIFSFGFFYSFNVCPSVLMALLGTKGLLVNFEVTAISCHVVNVNKTRGLI